MSLLQALAILAAGFAAGTINTIVGSGSLVTFPTLLAFGYSPVVANVSNTVGLVPGGVSGVLGYRRELTGQRQRLLRLGIASVLGGVTGAVLLLWLPPSVFEAVVPLLIAVGVVLVLAQPWIKTRITPKTTAPPQGSVVVVLLVYLAGVYGGYFGAAQGVILIGILGLGLADTMQRLNATKNFLALLVNLVAAIIFILVSDIAWDAAALIAVGSILGAQVGATVGRRLPDPVFRGIVAVIGVIAIVRLVG